jgi:hypothetical protein
VFRVKAGPTNHNAGQPDLDGGMAGARPRHDHDPRGTLGTQRWTGQVEVQGAASSPGTVALDYLTLIPQRRVRQGARA